jgi:hypothetical protein
MNVLHKFFVSLSLVLGSIFFLNACIIFFSQPITVQQNPDAGIIQQEYDSVKVRSVYQLKSGGLSFLMFSRSTNGYVNMFSPDDYIYIDSKKASQVKQWSYFFQHELAHIKQKRLVAKLSGGYPSYANPIRSFLYYKNLYILNEDYTKLMPEIDKEKNPFTPGEGLEAAADCYAQPFSSSDKMIYYVAPYLGTYCTAEQRLIARTLDSGKWPQPLPPEVEREVRKENVTTDPAWKGVPFLDGYFKFS